jgi:DNA-directed RNA polymerase subunit RPC12/RpoP
MRRQIAPPSYLPTMMLPCPYCGSWMTIMSIEPDAIEDELENITHGCVRCGTELIRTVRRLKETA